MLNRKNHPGRGTQKYEEMIIRLSQLLIDFPQISELDMNPILITDGNPNVLKEKP